MIAPQLLRGAARASSSSATSIGARAIMANRIPSLRRNLATETGFDPQDTRPQAKSVMSSHPALSAHTVEEIQHLSAAEILKEGGTRKEASMRHFTVNFG